jgi:hypothetical protein
MLVRKGFCIEHVGVGKGLFGAVNPKNNQCQSIPDVHALMHKGMNGVEVSTFFVKSNPGSISFLFTSKPSWVCVRANS